MRVASQPILAFAARLYAPLIVVFALSLLAVRAPGEGVGFIAGAAFALALIVQALAFGAGAARRALPPALGLLLLALGLGATAVAAGLPELAIAPHLMEAGAFVLTAAGIGLVVIVAFARAPTLKDAPF